MAKITPSQILAAEDRLRALNESLIQLRKLMVAESDYKGDWRETRWWKDCRKQYRQFIATSGDLLKKGRH